MRLLRLERTPGKLAGRLSILAAALLWSSGGLFAKSPLFGDWDESIRGSLLAFWRAAFAAIVLVPMIRRPRWSVFLVPMTVCFTAMCITYLSAMALTTAANAIWLQSTSPWWVFLLSLVAFREPVVRRDLIPMAFGLLGVGTILVCELAFQPQNAVGVACGLFSGVMYAAVVLFLRKLRDDDAAWLVGLNHLVAALLMLPWVLSLGLWPSPAQLAVVAAFGTFQMAIPYLLVSRGLRAIGSQEAVGICLIEPVLNPLWVYLVVGEVPAVWTLIGAGLILFGLALRYLFLERVDTESAGRRVRCLESRATEEITGGSDP